MLSGTATKCQCVLLEVKSLPQPSAKNSEKLSYFLPSYLGGRVLDEQRSGHDGGERGQVDDDALTLRFHHWQHYACHQRHREGVAVQYIF